MTVSDARRSSRRRSKIDLAIEALWLTGLVLLPLAFRGKEWVAFYSQPKFVLLHGVALSIVVLWTFEFARSSAASQLTASGSVFQSIDNWLDGRPERWAIIAVGGFGAVFVASTLLSPLPSVSIWGRDFGDQGYELYSTLSYLVIFGAIALRLRTREQAGRLLAAVVVTSVLVSFYAISQHFDWDPIGRGPDSSRVFSSLGNPLSLGALLVMTVPLTLAWGLIEGTRWQAQRLVVAIGLIGLQLAALWFAGGRGPWIGAALALVAFVVMAGIWADRRAALRMLIATIGAGVVAIAVTVIPGGQLETGRGLGNLGDIFGQTADAVSFMFGGGPDLVEIPETPGDGVAAPQPDIAPDSVTAISRALESLGSIDDFGPADSRSVALTNRADIWRASLDLALSRERPVPESSLVRRLRVLFGFGPDMFFYSYPIAASPQGRIETVSHAHDYALQVLMEQGIVGVTTILITAALLLLSAWRVFRTPNRERPEAWIKIVMIGAMAALIGRSADQFTGVARVSDLLLFWAIIGLTIAVAEINAGRTRSKTETSELTATRGRRAASRHRNAPNTRQAAYFAGAGVVAILALVIFVQRDLNPLRGGIAAADGFEQKLDDGDAALRSFEKAINLAPDVERYYLEAAGLYTSTAGRMSDPLEVETLLLAARAQLMAFEARNRFAWQTQLDLAAVAAALVANGNNEFTPEAVGRYRNVSALMPPFALIQTQAAVQAVVAGGYPVGIAIANRAITLEAETWPSPGAWWARGEAAFQLDRLEEAQISFETSLRRSENSLYAAASHRGLAFIAEIAGDQEGAIFHHTRADEIGG